MNILVKKLDENAKLPTRGSIDAAGYDLYALESVEVPVSGSTFVRTGLAIEIPEGYFGAIYARSGLACKNGIRPANCVGIIDSDFRGEVLVCLHNDSFNIKLGRDEKENKFTIVEMKNDPFVINAGDRIAQLVVQRYATLNFVEVDELNDSSRGEGGFGSTGSN